MPIVSLLTDFGLLDGYVGVMKGVIWKICPDAQIADITHHVSRQNIRQGAIALQRTVKYFPAGTVHIAVVDPGVGTNRKPLAAEIDGHYFIGPDNGLFSLVIKDARARGAFCRFFVLDKPEFWLPNVSRVFHGRDIFAPAGAHLANGIPIEKMGSPIINPAMLDDLIPVRQGNTIMGEVISVDNFGNLATNITSKHLAGNVVQTVTTGGKTIYGLVNTFGDRQPGDLTAMLGTEDDLIVAVVQGNAAELLGVSTGDPVKVTLSTGETA